MAKTDADGNLYEPDIIPEFEQRLTAAANTGNTDEVEFVQYEYNEARKDLVKRREAFEASRAEGREGEDNGVKTDVANADVQRSSESNPSTSGVR